MWGKYTPFHGNHSKPLNLNLKSNAPLYIPLVFEQDRASMKTSRGRELFFLLDGQVRIQVRGQKVARLG